GDLSGDAVVVTPSSSAADGEAAAARAPEPVIELPPLNLSPTTTITVIFSVGSNGMTQSEASRLRVGDLSGRGSDKLTDSIMLLISDPPTGKAALLSIPRDVWLSHRGHRINETFARRGAQAFIDDVSKVSGLPVDHLVQVNFTAFADLVDAVDGVTVQVPRPMADLYSALFIPEAGCWRLDGASALAYARSRHGLTTDDGGQRWRTAPNGNDFTRIARQQSLVAAAWDQLRGPSLVRRLPNLLRLANGVTIDAGLGIDDIVDLVKAFKDVAAGRVEGHLLPTVDRRVGRARVLGISYSRALPLYERLRSWPPGSHDAPPPAPASEEPSAEGSSAPTASDEPSAAASPSASPTPQQPAPAAAIPSTNCTRSEAFELPPNPLDYLASIADGDPTPYYRPTQSRPREEPSYDESSDPESGGPDATDEPSDPSASESEPEPEPSDSESEPEPEPRDLLPTPEPHDDDGDPQGGTARAARA
ncbi:MAG: LCP family protein required for cell wall assembly, partial [Glaciecola sp.]